MNDGIRNLDLYFSSDCNLNCKYCYIYKNKEKLQLYNELIVNNINNGKFIDNLKTKCDNFKDNINSIGLWGAEPTLNASSAKVLLPQLFDYFSNLNQLFFSTNCVLGLNGIKPFIDTIAEYNRINDRKIFLEIQFSLDGPEWITENNRGVGVTNSILKAIDETIKYSNSIDNCYMKFKVKPTLDMDTLRYMVSDVNKIIEWYCFFDNIQEKYDSYNKEDFDVRLLGYPTIVNPDIYTIDDGKTFSKFIKMISELDESYFKFYKHPMIYQPLSGINKIFFDKDLECEKGYGSCSAGKGSLSFDKDGIIHSCHRFFNYTPCPEEGLEPIKSFYQVNSDIEIANLNLLNYSYHNSFNSRYDFFKIVASSMAKYGQIDSYFLEDRHYMFLLFVSIQSIMCHFGQAEETKDPIIAQTGYIKLMGNGAILEILKYLRRYELI